MADIDDFAVLLFEEAKRFFEKARDSNEPEGKEANLHTALLLGVCALEAHINAIAEELLLRKDLSILDRSLLSERDYGLDKGVFELSNRLRMYRLEDRLQFIFKRFTKASSPTTTQWWSGIKAAIDLRNGLTHPKTPVTVTQLSVQKSLEAILACLNDLYKALYKKGYPGYARGMDSKLSF